VTINFCKFHGFGNDYIVIERGNIPDDLDQIDLALAICQRHTGVGSDGIAIIERLDGEEADFSCVIVNPDGSVAGFSGNGTRCAVSYIYCKGLWSERALRLKMRTGIKSYRLIEEIKRELAVGRQVHVFAVYTRKRDVTRRLQHLLLKEGIRVEILTAEVPPAEREAWYERQLRNGMQVCLAHPKLCSVGLDLLDFPVLLFYVPGALLIYYIVSFAANLSADARHLGMGAIIGIEGIAYGNYLSVIGHCRLRFACPAGSSSFGRVPGTRSLRPPEKPLEFGTGVVGSTSVEL